MKRFFTLGLKTACLLISLFHYNIVNAQVPLVNFQQVITGLTNPVDIVNAGDGSNRIFIVEQGGTIKVYNQALGFLGNFLTVTGIATGGELGLLSLAFHPNYNLNRYFFVYYNTTIPGPNPGTADDRFFVNVARYQTRADNMNEADPDTRQVIWFAEKPVGFTNHNGAKLNFGPDDGYLYFGTGDGGSGNDPNNLAQDKTSFMGKMLRINVGTGLTANYTIPPDNPFISDPDPNVKDEIWALGLRNPWRWSFDRLTHDMWLADVGQGAREEVNFLPSPIAGGTNFGWRCYEGTMSTPGVPDCEPPNHLLPIFEYQHNNTTGGISITGGYVYRGAEYPTLYGYYVVGDYMTTASSTNVWLIKPNGSGGWNIIRRTASPSFLVSFGEAEDGTLYASAGGAIHKVFPSASGAVPVTLLSFTVRPGNNYNELQWKTSKEINVREFSIEFSKDGQNFSEAGKLSPSGVNSNYVFRHTANNSQKTFYRLKIIDNDNSFKYSPVIVANPGKSGNAFLISSIVTQGSPMTIQLHNPFTSLRIYSAQGQLVDRQNLGNKTGIIYLNTAGWKKGVHMITLEGAEGVVSRRFVVQ